MTGLRSRAGRKIGRGGVGMLAVAVALLVAPVAPVAVATPDSDAADAAINQVWNADGGETGELGAKDGDVYQVGSGYGQNFAGGKVYFTPATGAHYMTGAILDKYSALGGPADSDLGFPTIDEGAGRAAGSRNSTFSAGDKPVIFWTPDNGAWVVRGAINAAWDKLGGSDGTLGVPTADASWQGDVVSQTFTGGQISWNPKTKEFTTTPAELAAQLTGLAVPEDATSAIAAARRASGGPSGPLGAPQGAQFNIGDAGSPQAGVGQNFAGGTIYYSPETGANVVTGPLLGKYQAAGGPQGDLGFPTSSEADGAIPSSRVVTFAATDQPVIFWTPEHGAFIVRGAMNAAWAKLGGAAGKLGAPAADQAVNGNVISQKFTGGSISWNKSTRAFSTEPAELASQLSGVKVPDLPKAAKDKAAEPSSKWYQFHWWWLLAIIPLFLVLVGIVVAAMLRRRRNAAQDSYDNVDDRDDFDDDGFGDGFGDREQYAADPYAPGLMSGGTDASDDDSAYRPSYWEDERSDEDHAGVDDDAFQDDPDVVDTAPNLIPKVGDAQESEPEVAVDDDAADEPTALVPISGATDDEPTVSVPISDRSADVADDQPAGPEPQQGGDTGYSGLAAWSAAGAGAAGLGAAGYAAAKSGSLDRLRAAVESHTEVRGAWDAKDSFADTQVPDPDADVESPDDTREPESDGAKYPSGPSSGRHAALGAEEQPTAQMSFRVAAHDGDEAPEGYAIKADTKSGLYWVPDSPGYDSAPAEIWFASEDFAVTNGFIKG